MTPEGVVIRGPFVVGSDAARGENFLIGGHQGRAVRVGTSIVFAETVGRAHECTGLRVMNEDGTNARDAPWQLPCRRDTGLFVAWVDMRNVAGHVGLLWSEYRDVRGSSEPWVERVRFALLDAAGRLASEPVDVTPVGASAISRFGWGPDGSVDPLAVTWFRTSLWVEEDGGVLASYASLSEEHTGVYARRIACASFPEE